MSQLWHRTWLVLSSPVPLTACLFTAFLLLQAGPSHALAADGLALEARGSVFVVEPGENFDLESGSRTFGVDIDQGLGGRLGLELLIGRRLGVTADLWSSSSLDVEVQIEQVGVNGRRQRATASDSLTVSGAALGLNLHLTPERAVDVYLGPLVSWVEPDDLSIRYQTGGGVFEPCFPDCQGELVSLPIAIDSDLAFGAALGFNWGLGDGDAWSLNLELRYLQASFDATDYQSLQHQLELDSSFLSIGIGRRF
jgi:hypothetical protein